MKAFPKLRLLDVSHSYVTNEGLNFLIDLKHLKRLDLTYTSTSFAEVAELKKALPDCEIVKNEPPPPVRSRGR